MNVLKKEQYIGHKGSIFSLTKGKESDTFYSGADEGYVVEWNLANQSDGKLLVKVNRPVYSMYLNKEMNVLACGTAGGNIHLIDLESKKETRNIEAHQLGVFDLQQLGDTYISLGGDGSICIWDMSFNLVKRIQASNKSARVLSVHPNRNEFAIGFSDCFIRIYNSEDFTLIKEIDAHSNSIFGLTYSPTGQYLYSGGRDVMLRNWNRWNNDTMELDIPAHTLHINAIAFSPNTSLFATVSMDKTLKIWDTKTNELLKVIDKVKHGGHSTSVNKLLWVDDAHILTCSDDKTIILWNLS